MNWARSNFSRYLAPVLCTGLLMGAAYAQRDWPERADAEPYHQRAKAAVDAIPMQIGPWLGKERLPQPSVIQVLRPNAIRNIEYIDPRAATLGRPGQQLWLSVVQTKRSTEMLGHFPPNCYPAFGDKLSYQQHRSWFVTIPGIPGAKPLQIPGVEYHFDGVINGKTYRRIVYNFMVAPGRGILSDMKMLEEAAEDYEQRYRGAAQFQVVFRSLAGQELGEAERDETFATLMRECAAAIDVFKSGK
jgi:hypothetical protein